MSELLGMNPELVRSKAALVRAQLSVLESAAGTVERAAWASLNPLSYGIQPGGLVIAPFAIGGTQAAVGQVRAARQSVLDLAQRLFDEADQQVSVSGRSDSSYLRGAVPKVAGDTAGPGRGNGWSMLMNILEGAGFVEGVHSAVVFGQQLHWFRSSVQGLSIWQMNKALPWANPLPWLRNPAVAKVVGGFGKGFAVLGIAQGLFTTVDGIVSGDGWKIADGVLTTVLAVGSLLPPPVGPVVAIAGLAYTAGKWIYENWDGITQVASTIGNGIATAATAVAEGVTSVAKGAADFVGDVAKGAADVIDKLWPW